jgi:hypothetical protein
MGESSNGCVNLRPARFRRIGLVAIAALALLTGFRVSAFAQSATGTLTGTITDPKGLAMVGVMVTVHNVDTGVDQKPVITSEEGVFQLPLLQPGNYDITASQPGFATVEHKGVTLQVGQTIRVDFAMPVAEQQSLVTVTTEIPLLETEKTEQSQNVSEALVSNLPVSSRRWEQFALLTPGVSPDGVSGGMSFHGINNLYNNNSVDGANNNYNYDGGSRGGSANDGYVYSADSIREFQVASSGFNAEVGQSAGGSVNAVTKSGTNMWHGDLFYNGRAPNFNAIDPVAKTAGATTQAVHQQHQWGGSVGGPIIKEKLFFFVTDDGYRKVFPESVTSQLTIPISALTCPTVASGAPGGTTAPNALQCQNTKDYINNHFLNNFNRSLRQDIELVKLDFQLNQANHISGMANIRDWHTIRDPLLQDNINNGADQYYQDRFVIANWTTVIGTNKVNELRYQFGIDNSFAGLNGSMGMPGAILSNFFGTGGYGFAGGGSSWTKERRHQVSDSFSWTVGTHSLKFGTDINIINDDARSSITSGGQYTYSSGTAIPNISCAPPTAFNTTANAKSNRIFCDWMVDVYGTNANDGHTGQHWDAYNQFFDNIFSSFPNTFRYNIPNNDYAGFFQDTWKARPNLTVNWGVRYDLQVITDLPYSVAKVLPILNQPGSLTAGSSDLPIFDQYTTKYPNEYDAIQPRIGIAWNFRKNTVLRLNGGIFFAKTEGHNIKNVISGAGESTTSCTITQLASCANPALTFPNVLFYQQNGALWTLGQSLPGAVSTVKVTPPPGGLAIPSPKFGIRGVDPNLRRPRVYTLDAAIEQQLPGNMNLSISYAFSRGVALPRGRDFNVGTNFDTTYCAAPASAGNQQCGLFVSKPYDILDASGNTTQVYTAPFYWNRVDSRTGVINGNTSDVITTYHGLIVSLRKPMSHGLEVVGNYTFSHAIDNGQQGSVNGGGEGQVGTPALDPFNTASEKGNSGTDVRSRFTASVVYAPTFGKNFTNPIAKQLADGWSLATSIIAQNGAHYTGMVQTSSPPSDVIRGFAPGSSVQKTFTYAPLDGSMGGAGVSSPGSPLAGRIGWLAPGSFVLPNLYNVDLRLTKQVSFKERYHIEIRLEAFNLFNTTLIQAVNPTAYDYATTCTGHTNTCMAPSSSFQKPTTTTGNLLGARQMQAGIRFDF